MKDHAHRSRWNAALALLAATGVVAASTAFPASALAQRGSGDRTGGGGGRDSSPRRDDSSSRRSDTPTRSESVSHRDSSSSPPPRVEYSTRRDSSPSYTPRADYQSRRDDTITHRDYTPHTPPYTSPYTRSDDSSRYTSRRDDSISSRRNDPSPHRDTSSYTNRNGTTRTIDPYGSRTRDDNTSRTNRDPIITPRGPGDIFNRSNPGRNTDSIGRDSTSRSDTRRTYDYNGRDVQVRTYDPAPVRNRSIDIFTRSSEGRHYENGISLRPGTRIYNTQFINYFPNHYASYPYYCPSYEFGVVFYSPYSYYYGVCPPYIYRNHCFYRPPVTVFIDVPLYVGGDCRGYDDDYYLNNDRYRDVHDSALDRAIDNIRETFRTGDIEPMVELTDPKVRIAIFRQGRYEYSIDPGDYLDMTRDALRTTETIQFDLYRIHRRAEGVYVVSGKHVYRNQDGERRTVYVSYVMERLYGRWTLTQVGTAPDHIQDPR